jgi:hypothetical protein
MTIRTAHLDKMRVIVADDRKSLDSELEKFERRWEETRKRQMLSEFQRRPLAYVVLRVLVYAAAVCAAGLFLWAVSR